MVDIDRGPDPLDSLAAFIANDVTRANRVGSLTDATHDRDAAITANFLVRGERMFTNNATSAQLKAAMDVLDCLSTHVGGARYCVTHHVGWLSDVDACARAEHVAEAVATVATPDPDLADRAAHLMALGWAVEKAASRGEVEVLIADLRASAHATQHHQETTT